MSLLKGVTGFVEVDNISQKCRAMNLKIKSLAYGVSFTVGYAWSGFQSSMHYLPMACYWST